MEYVKDEMYQKPTACNVKTFIFKYKKMYSFEIFELADLINVII